MNLKTDLTKVNFTSGRSGNLIKYIVIHYTAGIGDTDEGNGNYFDDDYRGVSAHYFVDEDSVTQTVKDTDTAWHCGLKKDASGNYIFQGPSGHTFAGLCNNSNSIGIEMCSDQINGQFIITEKTIENTIELVNLLMKKYNVPLDRVIRHYDVTGKICPRPFVLIPANWVAFKERIRKAMEQPVHWAQKYLDNLVKKGIINSPEAHKDLDSTMTKGQIFALLDRISDMYKP